MGAGGGASRIIRDQIEASLNGSRSLPFADLTGDETHVILREFFGDVTHTLFGGL